MEFTTVTITPEYAAALLANNPHNRPIKVRLVQYYAEQMRKGEWELNGETIKLSKSGTLMDGQHRLLAVIESKVPITAIIVTGVNEDSFATIDTGHMRGADDILALNGHKNSRLLASAARALILYEKGGVSTLSTRGYGSDRVSNAEVLEYVTRNQDVLDAAYYVVGHRGVRSLLPAGQIATPLRTLFTRANSEKSDEFFGALDSGVGLSGDSPIYLLRERLIAATSGKSKLRSRIIVALTVKAWNAYISGAPMKILRFTESGTNTEQMPEIMGV